ncbi:ribbon-helix-helix domain-containing protein [Blastomonas sp.]|uniref:ribbon-helix-helix domain-containing protein n=1 Tax=Blastomonas sp. TaxID=1909299 RepID=UPI00391CA82D
MVKRTNAQPVEPVRWNLKVSRETDVALRTLLASRGARRGDLSRFVEDAVNREIMRAVVHDIHARNSNLPAEKISETVQAELSKIRVNIFNEN